MYTAIKKLRIRMTMKTKYEVIFIYLRLTNVPIKFSRRSGRRKTCSISLDLFANINVNLILVLRGRCPRKAFSGAKQSKETPIPLLC